MFGAPPPIDEMGVKPVKLYHPTMHAQDILREGFGETSGTYLTETDYSGVWVFDRPVDRGLGGGGEAVMLELEMPEAVVLPFETFGHFDYRQFLMPAAILNLYGPPHVHDDD